VSKDVLRLGAAYLLSVPIGWERERAHEEIVARCGDIGHDDDRDQASEQHDDRCLPRRRAPHVQPRRADADEELVEPRRQLLHVAEADPCGNRAVAERPVAQHAKREDPDQHEQQRQRPAAA